MEYDQQNEQPLADVGAEMNVLGEIMNDNSLLDNINLTSADFYREANKLIFGIMKEMYTQGISIDTITLTDKLILQKKFDAVGGLPYITQLDAHFLVSSFPQHCKIVKNYSIKRQLTRIAQEVMFKVREDIDIENLLDETQSQILAISNKTTSTVSEDIGTILERNIEELSNKSALPYTGVPTNFIDLDKMTGGFKKGQLIILAARPAMGKTAFALNLAQSMATKAHKNVMIFSCEMTKEELVNRILSSISHISGEKISKPSMLSSDDWNKIWEVYSYIKELPFGGGNIYISDKGNITPLEIRREAKLVKHQADGLDVIFIDYLQLMSDDKHTENRQQEVSNISRALKTLAKELEVPIIALSQLSRSVESRQVKKPMLSDLRESGSIEQDADLVAFLYRDEYYNPDTELQNVAELIIAKHRNGQVGSINLFFNGNTMTFRSLSLNEMPQARTETAQDDD